jgi:predicted nucleic acid-binding protein
VLYVDSSALIKRYLKEPGSDAVNRAIQQALSADVPILTSVLTYAEIHAVLARKLREHLFGLPEYQLATLRFNSDWRTYLSQVELLQVVLDFVPLVVNKHSLKAADAIHLASALWVAQAVSSGGQTILPSPIIFVTSDKPLGTAADHEHFKVFNPQTQPRP